MATSSQPTLARCHPRASTSAPGADGVARARCSAGMRRQRTTLRTRCLRAKCSAGAAADGGDGTIRLLLVHGCDGGDCGFGGNTSFESFASHMCNKLQWSQENIRCECVDFNMATRSRDALSERYDLVVLVGVGEGDVARTKTGAFGGMDIARDVVALFAGSPVVPFACTDSFGAIADGALRFGDASRGAVFALPSSIAALGLGLGRRVAAWKEAAALFERFDSGDALYAILMMVDEFVADKGGSKLVAQTRRDPDLGSVLCIGTKCSGCTKQNIINKQFPAHICSQSRAATSGMLWSLIHQSTDVASTRPAVVVRILTITFVAPTHTTAGSCGDETIACLTDANCRGALVELQSCGLTDQVCQYKVITERESELFERFSSCVLQKYNCLNNTADIPLVPDPEPMAVWRGEALTHEAAESCLIGWMAAPSAGGGGDAWSWKVVAGQNAAYDSFPCQYQIFYRDRGGMWYDPVFKVILDDGSVWRRRHYRVRRERNAAAGRFAFTVIDNGTEQPPAQFHAVMDPAFE